MKRTILIQNPAYLKLKLGQLKIIEPKTKMELGSIPCEDIGYLILENPQIIISLQIIQALQQFKAAIISCDEFHMPQGLMLPFEGHTQMQAHLRVQINCSEPLKKQLWKQIVESKIRNQQAVLQVLGKPYGQMDEYVNGLKTGDSTNKEGQAANFYWKHLWKDFTRDRYGDMPNPLLNYGYSIIRSAMARAIVGSGLNPSFGVFHKSKYNAFCLADDLMEPYRPYVDYLVFQIMQNNPDIDKLTPPIKSTLLNIYNTDVLMKEQNNKFTEALTKTTSSLVQCLFLKRRKLVLPEFYAESKPF